MSVAVERMFYESIEIIKHQELLHAMMSSEYGMINKAKDKSKIHKKVHSTAYPDFNEQKPMQAKDLAKLLGSVMNGQ